MGLIWDIYWPVALLGLIGGLPAGLLLFRRDGRPKRLRWAVAVGAVAAATFGWHALHGAGTVRSTLESRARAEIERLEMSQVAVQLQDSPVSRALILSGKADSFQRTELARILSTMNGVREARWQGTRSRQDLRLPLAIEAELLALLGFCLGLAIAYVVELRRRDRIEWGW